MKLADALVETLLALDVKYIFGVSGANIEHFHDAIHRRGRGKLTSVLAKSEDGAAYMADCYARVNRTLGVCCSTSGGGMMNLVAGIAEAYQSSVPVLAIVGQPPAAVEGRGAFQDSSGIGRTVNAVAMFAAVSKLTRKVESADMFWESLGDAVVAALEGRAGPAVLLIPRNVYTADVPDMPPGFIESLHARIRPHRPGMNELLALLDQVRMARRPVLILGQGAQRTRTPEAVIAFARALEIPVATTMGAKGEFPNDDPNYLGLLGVAGHPSAHAFIRDECDLLFVAGTGLNTMTRAPFARDTVDLPHKVIVAVSADLGELRRVISAAPDLAKGASKSSSRSWWPAALREISCAVEADLGTAFTALHELWKEKPFTVRPLGPYVLENFVPTVAPSPRHVPADTDEGFDDETAPLSQAVAFTETLQKEAMRPVVRGNAPLLQSVALESLASRLPEAGTILYDAGNCASAALHILPVPAGVNTLIALGMGGMGFAIAGAIGAQLGAPSGTRSVVLGGDGAFLMVGLEIHTAVDLQLPILFVLFNNNMHGMCATRQQVFFESRFESVFYSPVNIAAVAKGLGPPDKLWVARVSTRDELEAALDDFAKNPFRPGVLELVLDVEEVPPFTPLLPREPLTRPGMRIIPSR